MKYYAFFIMASLAIGFYSCKKDSSTTQTPEKETAKIENDWRNDYTNYDMYAAGKLITSYTEKSTTDSHIVLNADGTGTFKSDGEVDTKFHYTFTNNTLKFTNAEYYGFSSNYKWLPINDFEYTEVQLGVNDLLYTHKGTVSAPAPYDSFVAKVHWVKVTK